MLNSEVDLGCVDVELLPTTIFDVGESVLVPIYTDGVLFNRLHSSALNSECEILLHLFPEICGSLVFVQNLSHNEVLFVSGTERFNSHRGEGRGFRFAGPYYDDTTFDSQCRRRRYFAIIRDPKPTHDTDVFDDSMLHRDFIAVHAALSQGTMPVATNCRSSTVAMRPKRARFITFLIACGLAKRKLIFCTGGEPLFMNEVNSFLCFLREFHVTIGMLFYLTSVYGTILRDATQIAPFGPQPSRQLLVILRHLYFAVHAPLQVSQRTLTGNRGGWAAIEIQCGKSFF